MIELVLATIIFTWDIANLREDGSALLPEEIVGYRIYSGDTVYPVVGLEYTLEGVTSGDHCFSISTVAKTGIEDEVEEGKKSDEVCITVPEALPNAPGNLTVTVNVNVTVNN